MSTTPTPVDTGAVKGRRDVHFNSLDELLLDAEKLAASPTTRTLGNWPLGQLITHLAHTMNHSIDGIAFRAPWYLRVFGWFIKGRVLRNCMPAGFNLPKEVEV